MSAVATKQELGQFYTTQHERILRGLEVPLDVLVIEPFVGQGHLLAAVGDAVQTECYDIVDSPAVHHVRDTLVDPPDYAGAFVLTNPPYLARNKATDKTAFDKYGENDLYKCFIRSLLIGGEDQRTVGGILIVPLNFWSSIVKSDITLRRDFLEAFSIVRLNIFDEPVFDDTSYTVCAFQFEQRADDRYEIDTHIYPSEQTLTLEMSESNNYTFGGKIYTLPQSSYTIERWTTKHGDTTNPSNILLKCIDDSNPISCTLVDDDARYKDETTKLSARSYATLVITPEISLSDQYDICEAFNAAMTQWRTEYHSLFLTNYRENGRKRISFALAYSIISWILRDYQ
jgi:hypothetical protein